MHQSASPLAAIFQDLKDALAGREHDYTQGKIGRAIMLLSVPMILEMMMEAIFGVVDVFFVSKISNAAVATVALTESVMTMIYAVGIGLSMGVTSMVARRIGENRREDAIRAAVQGIFLGVLVSLPITLVGFWYGEWILAKMGAEADVLAVGKPYMTIMLMGNFTIIGLFVGNAVFRGAGNPVLSMYVLIVANTINIILDPCLIFGWGPFPEMGLTGAAVATNIGRGVGIVLQFVLLFRGAGIIKFTLPDLRLDLWLIRRLGRISIGGIFQFMIATTSWVFIVRYVAKFGSDALAGYGIAIRIIVFTILPAWGISNAAATLVGQNLGAGNPDRAEQSVWVTCRYNMVFFALVMLLFLGFAEPLIQFFNTDPVVVAEGALCLRVVSYGYIFFAVGMVITSSFNGSGDTWTPTRINFFCYWMLQISLVHFLSQKWGTTGIYAAIAIAESMLAVVSAYIFRKGHWKRTVV